MYGQAETGYDYPEPQRGAGFRGKVRPAKVARRLIIALIIGALAGLAIMLQVKGWSTLASESGGSCGSGDNGVSYGACPRGITPALITSFLVGLPAVPAAIALLFMKGWFRRGFLVVGVAGGLLAGQSLFGIWHGTDLAVGWSAPFDNSSDLGTVGAWSSGDSLIRVRVDEVVSYSAATGVQQWSVTIPGTDVACAVSGLGGNGGPGSGASADSGTGLVMYGQDSTLCDHVMAVNLATGRQLWAVALPGQLHGASEPGQLAVAGGTAVAMTDDGPVGLSLATGAMLWGPVRPSDCDVREVAGSGSTLIALVDCFSGTATDHSYDVLSLSPATGKQVWDHRVTGESQSTSEKILSVSPAVIGEIGSGPRGTTSVRVLGADGTQEADFRVDGITLNGEPVALEMQPTEGFGIPDFVANGLLVGLTTVNGSQSAIAAFRLSDGQRQWVTTTPDQVHDIAPNGDGASLALVDESDPTYSLETISLATGKLTSLGGFSQGSLEQDASGLYVIGGRYIIVNQHGDSSYQVPVAEIMAPPKKK